MTRTTTEPQESTFYYRDLGPIRGGDGAWDIDERLPEVLEHGKFTNEDRVLDIGCAEGLITLSIAPRVRHVHAVEIRKERVLAARLIAQERGVENVRFETGSIFAMDLPAKFYDVVMFLGVFQHLPKGLKWPTLVKVMEATRRSVLFRTPLFHRSAPNRVVKLTKLCQQMNFSLCIYPRQEERGGNFMVLNRMGD